MGSWESGEQYEKVVQASNDVQVIDIVFPDYSVAVKRCSHQFLSGGIRGHNYYQEG